MRKSILATFFTILMLLPVAVLAAPGDTSVGPILHANVELPPRPNNWDTRCEAVQEKLLKKVALFSERRELHLQRYEELQSIFTDIKSRLEVVGYDVSPLDEPLSELENLIDIFGTTSDRFIFALELAATVPCDDYETFAQALADARAGLKGTRLAAADIRQFISATMIPAVRDILEGGIQ